MLQNYVINCVIILTVHLSFMMHVTKAYYDTVNINIKHGNEIIELNWKRMEQHLANNNLPVWNAAKNTKPRLIPNVFAELGDFLLYQDVEKSSAVVYLSKNNAFYGIIDTRFYVAHLPLLNPESNTYHVGENYVFIREDYSSEQRYQHSPDSLIPTLFTDDQINYVNSLIDSANIGSVPGPVSQPSYHNQVDYNVLSTFTQMQPIAGYQDVHQDNTGTLNTPSIILYPEILVFVTNDIFEKFMENQQETSMMRLLLYYLTYFNAIDMLFKKLANDGIAIRINIAGLVIETEPKTFPHRVRQCRGASSNKVSTCFHSEKILYNYPIFITKYEDIFAQDSFDFYFVSTSRPIWGNGRIIHGKSTPPLDVFTRKLSRTLRQNLLGSILGQEGHIDDYVTAAHEIAQLMSVRPDQTCDGLSNDDSHTCHTIMQGGRMHCKNCLQWSEQSRNDLITYVRSNRNHCFLLNYPRSLYPFGQPVSSLSPEDQCVCYNFPLESMNPFYIITIPDDSCDKRMQCSSDLNSRTLMPLPLDGTPCGRGNKVCWRERCVEIHEPNCDYNM